MMKKKQPVSAKVRVCPECRKQFKPMTDAMWAVNYRLHVFSEKHKQALAGKSQAPSE